MAATFVLSSVTHAQESAGSALDTLTIAVERYVACRTNVDPDCIAELTDRQFYEEAGITSNEVARQRNNVLRAGSSRYEDSTFEVAQAWEPFVSGDQLVSIVPYYESVMDDPEGRRREQMGFLFASSYDNGESWRFAKIEGVSAALAGYIEREYPGIAGRPLPPVIEQMIREPVLERGRSAMTSERKFVMVGDGFAYAMKWEIRTDMEGALDLAILYDNPANRSETFRFLGSVEPGQQVLEWQSPVLTAFAPGETYEVVVEIRAPDSGDVLIEHRQPLLFQPTREMWRAVMSQPPVEQSN